MFFRRAYKLVAVVVLSCIVQPAFAVYETVEIKLSANKLAGTVVDPSGAELSGVDVSLHRCTLRKDGAFEMNEKVLGRVKTDAAGRFGLPPELHPSSACLSFRATGFNPLLVKIHWSKSAPRLAIKMPIGG